MVYLVVFLCVISFLSQVFFAPCSKAFMTRLLSYLSFVLVRRVFSSLQAQPPRLLGRSLYIRLVGVYLIVRVSLIV
jgi:hypothetical protein